MLVILTMESSNLKIEYKKFNSFLKDYIRMMNRGWLFMRINEEYNIGKEITFDIKVAELHKELKAVGIVAFSGLNDQGNHGIGFTFAFDEPTREYLSGNIPAGIKESYGEFWGSSVLSYLEER
ncbi:MAG TPA: hypothetical protein P5044_10275 [bacterium]|nr:hypothetical protein [bacterium]